MGEGRSTPHLAYDALPSLGLLHPVLFQDAASHDVFVDFIRTVIDAGRPLVPEEPRKWCVVRHSKAAVDLNGPVEDLLKHASDRELDE